jgi:hypothetical protein
MSADTRDARRRRWRTGLLYAGTGLAVFLIFLCVWDHISEYRVAIIVLLVVLFVVLQARDWKRMERDRVERRRRRGSRRVEGRTKR